MEKWTKKGRQKVERRELKGLQQARQREEQVILFTMHHKEMATDVNAFYPAPCSIQLDWLGTDNPT